MSVVDDLLHFSKHNINIRAVNPKYNQVNVKLPKNENYSLSQIVYAKP